MAEPPSYDDPDSAAPVVGTETIQPSTLYVAGRFIHPSDPHSPPLYELSHSVGFLRDTDRKVTFSRLDYSVRGAASGTPQVATRPRAVFDLTHRTPAEMPTYVFQAEAKSRSVIGSLGMETIRSRRFSLGGKKGFRVVHARWGHDRRLVGGDVLYTAMPPSGSRGEVSWEWTDDRGAVVAREMMRDDMLSLEVKVEMTQALRDALVGSWIMRVWWELAERSLGLWQGGLRDHARHIFAQNRTEMPSMKGSGSMAGAAGGV